MIIGIKDVVKLIGISIVACCAVFVCTLFLNYNMDIADIKVDPTNGAAVAMYDSQVMMGKVTAIVTGGCLVVTSAIMLLFYVKNHIDSHASELGILKALGQSDFRVAKHFWVFGLSVFTGCIIGYLMAMAYLPEFYSLQNAEGLFPSFAPRFHFEMILWLVIAPTAAFGCLSVIYAYIKLKTPVLELIRGKAETCRKFRSEEKEDEPFLSTLKKNILKERKSLVFFTAFSAFCFSAMVQMSMSMNELASETFAWMILIIGLILAIVTVILSLESVVKGNAKTVALMKVCGYSDLEIESAVFGRYRPISYIGFAIGTVYQYALLKLVMTFVFSAVENMPEYNFSFKWFFITLAAFILFYEIIIKLFAIKVKKSTIKCIMTA